MANIGTGQLPTLQFQPIEELEQTVPVHQACVLAPGYDGDGEATIGKRDDDGRWYDLEGLPLNPKIGALLPCLTGFLAIAIFLVS